MLIVPRKMSADHDPTCPRHAPSIDASAAYLCAAAMIRPRAMRAARGGAAQRMIAAARQDSS